MMHIDSGLDINSRLLATILDMHSSLVSSTILLSSTMLILAIFATSVIGKRHLHLLVKIKLWSAGKKLAGRGQEGQNRALLGVPSISNEASVFLASNLILSFLLGEVVLCVCKYLYFRRDLPLTNHADSQAIYTLVLMHICSTLASVAVFHTVNAVSYHRLRLRDASLSRRMPSALWKQALFFSCILLAVIPVLDTLLSVNFGRSERIAMLQICALGYDLICQNLIFALPCALYMVFSGVNLESYLRVLRTPQALTHLASPPKASVSLDELGDIVHNEREALMQVLLKLGFYDSASVVSEATLASLDKEFE
jgi:hypothetical protein